MPQTNTKLRTIPNAKKYKSLEYFIDKIVWVAAKSIKRLLPNMYYQVLKV
jgi:hypothetical protein